MQIPAAFIIRGRIKNNDFPYNFLVSPENFSAQKVTWARKFAVDSTRYFDLNRDEGRRVIFCDDEYVVSGVSIDISALCEKCEHEATYAKVDGDRNNYAFMGFVFKKGMDYDAFDIPYEMFLGQYERYMSVLWEIPSAANGLDAVTSQYEMFSFPEVYELEYDDLLLHTGKKLVIDSRSLDIASLTASITKRMWRIDEFSFCSNLPNGKSVLESDFSVVTSSNSDAIRKAIQEAERQKLPEKNTEIIDIEDENTNEDSKSVRLIKRVLGGILIVIGAIVVFISGKFAQDYFPEKDEGGFTHEN